jgi:hypothetical protein
MIATPPSLQPNIPRGPVSSSHAGSISSSSGQYGSLSQAASSSMSSSESGSFHSKIPSGYSSHVGGNTGSYSDRLGSSFHLGSTERSH